jgi:hypothetical protein
MSGSGGPRNSYCMRTAPRPLIIITSIYTDSISTGKEICRGSMVVIFSLVPVDKISIASDKYASPNMTDILSSNDK